MKPVPLSLGLSLEEKSKRMAITFLMTKKSSGRKQILKLFVPLDEWENKNEKIPLEMWV